VQRLALEHQRTVAPLPEAPPAAAFTFATVHLRLQRPLAASAPWLPCRGSVPKYVSFNKAMELIYIDSRYRINGTTSDFSWALRETLKSGSQSQVRVAQLEGCEQHLDGRL
jgi:hypothetical protein